jgi:hypothetical protein
VEILSSRTILVPRISRPEDKTIMQKCFDISYNYNYLGVVISHSDFTREKFTYLVIIQKYQKLTYLEINKEKLKYTVETEHILGKTMIL